MCDIAKFAVHGMEYGFGAHDFPFSGVFEVEPKNCPGFIYRCSIPLGRINMPVSEFHTFLENVASEYHGDTYHLISNNCNHFTDDMANRLTGKGIPGWVNRLAKLGKLSLPVYSLLISHFPSFSKPMLLLLFNLRCSLQLSSSRKPSSNNS